MARKKKKRRFVYRKGRKLKGGNRHMAKKGRKKKRR